jgi:hypothetical protein
MALTTDLCVQRLLLSWQHFRQPQLQLLQQIFAFNGLGSNPSSSLAAAAFVAALSLH